MYKLDWVSLEGSHIAVIDDDRAIIVQDVGGKWSIFCSVLYGPVLALPKQFETASEAMVAADIIWNSLVRAVSSQMN